jgi:hypothetical protein
MVSLLNGKQFIIEITISNAPQARFILFTEDIKVGLPFIK